MEIKKLQPNFTDARGSITDLLAGQDMDAITFITTKKGGVRGNHYHNHTVQYDYIVSGSFTCVIQKGENGEIETETVTAGDLIFQPATQRHAYKALEDSVFISMTKGPRMGTDFEKDVIRLETPLIS